MEGFAPWVVRGAVVCTPWRASGKDRATQLDPGFKSHVCHECSCTGADGAARFSLVLSREDAGCEVSSLSWFPRWISGFLDVLMKIFLERHVVAVLLTDTLVGTVRTSLEISLLLSSAI